MQSGLKAQRSQRTKREIITIAQWKLRDLTTIRSPAESLAGVVSAEERLPTSASNP